MATLTLNLPIERGIAERIQEYAETQKISISRLVENFFTKITTASKEQKISPLVKSFSIDGVDIPANFDYKKELAQARNKKYTL